MKKLEMVECERDDLLEENAKLKGAKDITLGIILIIINYNY